MKTKRIDFDLRYNAATSQDKKVIANTLVREMSIHGDAEYV